jgi:hypothetical protein
MTQDKPTAVPESSSEPIVATAGQYYRNMRYLMCVGLIAVGIWFGYDGFVGYPQKNRQIAELKQLHEQAARNGEQVKAAQLLEQLKQLGDEKTDWDMMLQKVLCVALPALGIGILVWALYRSRGEYRLEGNLLYVPGKPPVPFENITEIDRHLWDRKGIAKIHYDLGDGRKGKLTLDDFVYERPPTDAIFERIERFVLGSAAQSPAPQEQG